MSGVSVAFEKALASFCGDLARVVGGAETSPLPLLKSPRQTIQVSDIQRCCRANLSAMQAVEKSWGQRTVVAGVGLMVEERTKSSAVERQLHCVLRGHQ